MVENKKDQYSFKSYVSYKKRLLFKLELKSNKVPCFAEEIFADDGFKRNNIYIICKAK